MPDRTPDTGPLDPEEEEYAAAPAAAEIPASTTMGPVHLTVSDLDRSVAFYRQSVGLQELDRGNGTARLGTPERALLDLTEEVGARQASGYSGLYHFALLVPERRDLALWLAHAIRDRVPLAGLSDHFVSEAIYLSDPDGHGIEIYGDRPRDVWDGQVAARMTTRPLDVEGLLEEAPASSAESFSGLPGGTVMGHVHLRVASIPETIAFYQDVLGFALMARFGAQAAFLAAGGYHHHLGANTWESAGAPAAPTGFAALRGFTLCLPSAEDARRLIARLDGAGWEIRESSAGSLVDDPSGNTILIRASSEVG
jgi:catechol 2,3-dioxygenase